MAKDDEDEFRPAVVPVALKPTSRLGMQVSGTAKKLGDRVVAAGSQVGHDVRNGFIMRAVRSPLITNVFILDPPARLLFAGWCAYSTTSAPYTINNGAPQVGNRDDFTPPGYKGDGRAIVGETWAQIGAPGNPPATDQSEPNLYYVHMQPVVLGKNLMLGLMRYPTVYGTPYLNDTPMNHFGNANTVRVGCAYRYPPVSYSPTEGPAGNQYMGLNSFWVSEGDLPSGWRFLPRRLADTTDTRGVFQPAADWACWTPGANVIPATGVGTDTIDEFLMVVQCVNQIQDTWVSDGNVLFDQQGQHALALMYGTLDRKSLSAEAPQQLFADIKEIKLVLATDISTAALHPTPAVVFADQVWSYYGSAEGSSLNPAPERPNVAYFMQPQVQRCTDGFITFCTYWAPYWSSNPSTGYVSGEGYNTPGTTLYSVVIILPSGSPVTLKGDIWTVGIGTFSYPEYQIPLPDIADMDDEYSVVPWIVGTETVARTTETGDVTRTAYALVWEEHRSRTNATIMPAVSPTGTGTIQPSYSMGGDWVLYSIESGVQPVRTILTTSANVAPVFSMQMVDDRWMPGSAKQVTVNLRPVLFGSHLHISYSSCYQMAPNLLVTAGLDATIATEVGVWVESGDTAGVLTSIEHNIYCVVVDVETGEVTKRGVITTRTKTNFHFHVTVAQPEVPATDTTEAVPATLLATQFDIAHLNNGIENTVAGKTQTYLSVDGGYTWSVYVTDMAAPNGAFLLGNQLWGNDVTSRYDEDLA